MLERITPETVNLSVATAPKLLLAIMNDLLGKHVLPKKWKTDQVTLIPNQ